MQSADDHTAATEMDITALSDVLSQATSTPELRQQIVNAPFIQRLAVAEMFLGIIVLLIANKKTGMIDRVALSSTELAKNTTEVSYVPFSEIKIPLDDPENIIAKAIRTNDCQDTTDWYYLFTPAMSAEQARINQASGGISYSAVYPLTFGSGGAMIFSYFQYLHNIGKAEHLFMKQYAQLVSEVLIDNLAAA